MSDEPSIGTTVGRYRILERIGEGGMGVVYRAEQEPLGRSVALKLIHKGLASEPEIVSRFLREARIAGSLTNPNTVTIYDFGRADDGSLYLAMEFIEGESLKRRLEREGVIPPADVAAIGMQVCRSLLEAHRKEIAHRDLKPENILLSTTEDGTLRVKVLDYGLARSVNPSETGVAAQVTQTGMILGTPEYMSPEQARGLPVDTRSDIYSLGIVLYEMLCGVTPFGSDSNISVLASHVVHEPPPIAEMGRRVRPPRELDVLVRQMLAKDPEERPSDVLDVLRVLKQYLLGEQPAALSQVFMDPSADEEEAATETHTAALPDTTLDESTSEPAMSSLPSSPSMPSIGTTPPPLEGDRTIVNEQAFPDDESDDDLMPDATSPRARSHPSVLVDDARTAPATPALLSRGSRMADDLAPPGVDSSVLPDLPPPDRPSRPRSEPRPAPRPPAPRVTEQVAERRKPPRSFESQETARALVPLPSELDEPEAEAVADLATAVTVPPESPPPPQKRRARTTPEPEEKDPHRETSEIPTRGGPGLRLQMVIVGVLAVVTGVALALWITRTPRAAAGDDGLPAGYTEAMPPPEGWAGTYDTGRGPLVLDQQADSLAGSLGGSTEGLRLAGRVEGTVFRFAWAVPDTGAPVTAQGSGRGEARWYVGPDGKPTLRATLGYGSASVGAGAVWATRRQ